MSGACSATVPYSAPHVPCCPTAQLRLRLDQKHV